MVSISEEVAPGQGPGFGQGDRAALTAQLVELLAQLRKLALASPGRAQAAGEGYEDLSNLTLHQLEALGCVGTGVTMGEFARCMAISDSAATALVGRLVKAGFVERVASEADRRVVRVALSDRAKTALDAFRRYKDGAAERLVAHLDDATMEKLVGVLSLVLEAYEDIPAVASVARVRP